MSAERFLELAEQRELLDQRTLSALRDQLRRKGSANVSAQQLAQLLITKERLTRYQANKLVEDSLKAPANDDDALELALEDSSDEELVELKPIAIEPTIPSPASPPASVSKVDEMVARIPSRQRGGSSSRDGDLLESVADEASILPPQRIGGRTGSFARMWDAVGGLGGRGRNRPRTQRWDSVLMLFGGGALLLLAFIGVMLYVTLIRGSGDDLIALAQEDYAAQSYAQAIGKYDKFLSRFPKHPKHSVAVVQRTLSKLRQQSEAQNWNGALEIAKGELPGLVKEEAFGEARGEFAGILPKIYAGFVAKAKQSDDVASKEQLLALATQATELVDSPEYLPASVRRGLQDQLDTIQLDFALVQRDVQRQRNLELAIQKIAAALVESDTTKAYAVQDELLAAYPGLRDNAALAKSLVEVVKKEQGLVTVAKAERGPTTAEPVSETLPRVILTNRQASTPLAIEGVTYARTAGSLVALSLHDGSLLWRRYLGTDLVPNFQATSSELWSDVVAVDAQRNELVRFAGRDGKSIWRLHLPAHVLGLRAEDERLFVPLENRQLYVVSAATGEARVVTFPQRIATAPASIVEPNVLVQPAEHSTAYILDAKTLECVATSRLGHAPDTISAVPAVLGRFVFFVENAGVDFAWLRTWQMSETPGEGLKQVGEPIRVAGNLHVSPATFGQSVALVTDRQGVNIFQVDPASTEKPPLLVASLPATDSPPVDAFAVFEEDRILVASRGLAEYRLQTAAGRLVREAIAGQEDVTIAAPRKVAPKIIIQSASRQHAAGTVVRALRVNGQADANRGIEELWSTELANGPISEPVVVPAVKGIVYTGHGGRIWIVDGSHFKTGHCDAVQFPDSVGSLLAAPLSPKDDVLLYPFLDGSPRIAEISLRGGDKSARLIELTTQKRRLTCRPLRWQDKILVCVAEGSVYLLDPEKGTSDVVPFQPPQVPNQRKTWIDPCVLVDSTLGCVVADKEGIVFRLQLSETKPVGLFSSADTAVGGTLVGGLATLGELVFAVQRTEKADSVVALSASSLQRKGAVELSGRVVGGPWLVSNLILVSTSDGMLSAFGAEGTLVWSSPLSWGALAGAPLDSVGGLACASASGMVWRIDSATGQPLPWNRDSKAPRDHFDLGEPLGAGPVQFGAKLLFVGSEGTMFVQDPPE